MSLTLNRIDSSWQDFAAEHQISGNDLDLFCSCGWYNHDPRPGDRSATAHILRAVAKDGAVADLYEAAYRRLFGMDPA